MKVIAFPYAGGSENSYNFFKNGLKERGIKLKVIEYPGRGYRLEEKLLKLIDEVVVDALKVIVNSINKKEKYIIYGHSLGALVAYLICLKIEKLKLPKPIKLVVSGIEPPSVKKNKNWHLLPQDIFWEKISELGGIPNEIIKEKELLDFYEPILRSDFEVFESYNHNNLVTLNIPINVLNGDKDRISNCVDEWGSITNSSVQVSELKGDHFFIYDNTNFLIDLFQTVLCD